MLRKEILCILCLLMIVSVCTAEEIPAQACYCKIHMYPEIPGKTMKQMFSEYMVPGCEVYYEENEAWCRSLLDDGDRGWLISDSIIEDNERIRACREIAERLLHMAYPEDEPELITAMPYRTFKECEIRTEGWELKDGQWYYFGRPLTQELEAAITDALLIAADRRERTEKLNPDWTILQYHPGTVCGLPTGIWLDDGKEYMDFCLSVFIFDTENHVVSACLGGGFSAESVRETAIAVTEEKALQLARELVISENSTADWRYRGWDDMKIYDHLLQELGCSSIREKMVPEDSVRLVMAVNRKGQLQPAWECTEHRNLLMDDEVVQQSSGPLFFYLSAEDGLPLNP